MIILDANILIGFLDRFDAHHTSTIALLSDLSDDDFATPALTISEALVHPHRGQRHLRSLASLRRIGVSPISMDSYDDIVRIAEVRDFHGLRMPDAVVLAAAISRGAAVATFDARLTAAARDAGVAVVPA